MSPLPSLAGYILSVNCEPPLEVYIQVLKGAGVRLGAAGLEPTAQHSRMTDEGRIHQPLILHSTVHFGLLYNFLLVIYTGEFYYIGSV